MAAMTGTDEARCTRERPGMSAFAFEGNAVYQTYSDLSEVQRRDICAQHASKAQ